jgi:endonuclease I
MPAVLERLPVVRTRPVDLSPKRISEYYAPTQGATGAELLQQLHRLSAQGHEPRTYEGARRKLFSVVEDLPGTDVVRDLYTGQAIEGVTGLAAATRAGLTTEHVWPQSEGATEAARSDLHHLRPALTQLNSHRSNLPFGEAVETVWESPPVEGIAERSRVGPDASGTKVFTPRASIRGDLARDQLYVFTRYHAGDADGVPAGFSTSNFRHSLPTLLQWHRDDPVDGAERARHEAIVHLQGNRNPFIDQPDLVDRIGLESILANQPG